MGLKTWIACAALGATVVTGAGVAVAQDGKAAENAVKVRKAQMQIYAYNLGVLGAMAKGQLPYDAETATNAANSLAAASGMRIPGAWLPGTDSESFEVEPDLLCSSYLVLSHLMECSMHILVLQVWMISHYLEFQ